MALVSGSSHSPSKAEIIENQDGLQNFKLLYWLKRETTKPFKSI